MAAATGEGSPAPEHVRAAVMALAGILGLEILFTLVRLSLDRLWVGMAASIMGQIVSDVFYRVQRFSTDWHANSFAGATVRKITRGRGAYSVFTDTLFWGLVPALLIIIGMTVMIGLEWPVMGAFLGGLLAFYIVVSTVLATQFLAPANRRFVACDTRLGAMLADSVTCNAVVKAFGGERREDTSLGAQSRSWARLAEASWARHIAVHMVQKGMSLVLMAGMLGLALWLWAHERATAGQITMVLTSYFVIAAYIRFLGQHMRNLQQAVNDMEDMVEFMHLPLGVGDRLGASPFRPHRGEIEFRDVTFGYENQPEPLYRGFNLTIPAGQRVGLVGRSGSGKSTFVKLVQRLYDVDSGALMIDGQNIAHVAQESLRQAIALVPQEPVLFHRSLRDNIAYGRPGASFPEIVEAAKKAHAHDFITRLQDGYETLVGERGVKLSGGERQRVALARAFLADAPILILDEATSSLDSHTEALIQESIEALMRGRTTIVVAHRLSTIRGMDRILVFDRGRIVEEGSHGELMAATDTHYRTLVAIQTGTGRQTGTAGAERRTP